MKYIFSAILLISSSVFAADESEKDFGDTILAPRFKECKDHFDIKPYFILAVGADQDESINEEVIKSIKQFSQTGHLIIPESKARDTIAISCATYAEGMLAGGIGTQIVSALAQASADSIVKGTSEAVEAIGKGINETLKEDVLPEKDKK